MSLMQQLVDGSTTTATTTTTNLAVDIEHLVRVFQLGLAIQRAAAGTKEEEAEDEQRRGRSVSSSPSKKPAPATLRPTPSSSSKTAKTKTVKVSIKTPDSEQEEETNALPPSRIPVRSSPTTQPTTTNTAPPTLSSSSSHRRPVLSRSCSPVRRYPPKARVFNRLTMTEEEYDHLARLDHSSPPSVLIPHSSAGLLARHEFLHIYPPWWGHREHVPSRSTTTRVAPASYKETAGNKNTNVYNINRPGSPQRQAQLNAERQSHGLDMMELLSHAHHGTYPKRMVDEGIQTQQRPFVAVDSSTSPTSPSRSKSKHQQHSDNQNPSAHTSQSSHVQSVPVSISSSTTPRGGGVGGMVHWYSIDARPVTIDNTTATTTTTGDQVLLQSKSSSSGIYKKTQTYALKKHYKRQMTSSSSAAAAAGKGVASVWTTGSDSVPIIESGKWAHVADRHRVMQVAPEGSSSRKRGSQPPPSTGKENNQPAPTTNFNNASGAGGGRRSVSWIARDFFESGFVQCLDGVQDVLANLETEFKGEEGSGVDD